MDNANKAQSTELSLSECARILRSKTSTPEERKKAAAMLGSKGGTHSHDKQNKAKGSNSSQ